MVIAVLVYSRDPAAESVVRDRFPDRADAADRGARLRGHPVHGRRTCSGVGCGCSSGPDSWCRSSRPREPDLDQLEVAIASLRAVFTAEQTAEVDARVGRLVPAIALFLAPSRSRSRLHSRDGDVQLTWTGDELLAGHDVAEPLVAGGVRCHGGFDADGAYVSPRTRNRVPAITAWQESHRDAFGTEILDVPLALVARSVPERRAVEVPAPGGRARTDDLVADAHRHRRGLRRR